jgi:hypothetical protein
MSTMLYLHEPEASPVQQASSEQFLVQDSSGTKEVHIKQDYQIHQELHHSRNQNILVSIVTGCMAVELGSHSQQKQEMFLLFTVWGEGGCSQPPEDSFHRSKVAGGLKLTPHIHHVLRLRMGGNIHPPSHMSSWSGA